MLRTMCSGGSSISAPARGGLRRRGGGGGAIGGEVDAWRDWHVWETSVKPVTLLETEVPGFMFFEERGTCLWVDGRERRQGSEIGEEWLMPADGQTIRKAREGTGRGRNLEKIMAAILVGAEAEIASLVAVSAP